MIKYPHLRKPDSFVNIIINSNLMEECLKIATDVLMADKDCHDFVINCDFIFNGGNKVIIVDETNNSLISNY
jgi:hypothetical protein